MRNLTAISFVLLLMTFTAPASAQKSNRIYAEGYGFWSWRAASPVQGAAGGGGEILPFKGLAFGGDIGTTVGRPDDKIRIASVGGSYHFLCCRYKSQVEPFAGAGWGFLSGNINTHGRDYPGSSNQRNGPYFNQGLIIWPLKHVGARIELREYRMFVSYGPLADVIFGGTHVEFRLGVTFR